MEEIKHSPLPRGLSSCKLEGPWWPWGGVGGLPASSQPPSAPLCVFQCFLFMVIILMVEITVATVVLAFFLIVKYSTAFPTPH